MENLRKIIGNNLKYYRYKSGLSQEKYYEKYGFNNKYLASIERGEVNISADFIQKLSESLGISVKDLVTYDESKIISFKRVDSKENRKKK